MDSPYPVPRDGNISLSWNNYCGVFWVTLLTVLERRDFGDVVDGQMKYTLTGQVLKGFLEHIHMYFDSIVIPKFIVLPDSVEALIMVREHNGMDPYIPFAIECVEDLVSTFRDISMRSICYAEPININVWIYRMREIDHDELQTVLDACDNGIAIWLATHKRYVPKIQQEPES